MSPEFAKVCRRLLVAIAVLGPFAAAALLSGTQAALGAEPVKREPVKKEQAKPPRTPHIADLGRARAVSWISTGHLSISTP